MIHVTIITFPSAHVGLQKLLQSRGSLCFPSTHQTWSLPDAPVIYTRCTVHTLIIKRFNPCFRTLCVYTFILKRLTEFLIVRI